MRKVILIILSFLSINSVLFGQNKLDIAPFDQCGFKSFIQVIKSGLMLY